MSAPTYCFLLTPQTGKKLPFYFSLLYLMPDDFTPYTQDNFTCRRETPWGLNASICWWLDRVNDRLAGKTIVDITSKVVAFYHKVFLLYPILY